MSGIGVGSLLAFLGVMFLCGAQEQAGLIFVIFGFVCLFTGIASQQDQKRLKEAQLKALTPPQGPDESRSLRAVEDESLAAAVRGADTLPALSAPLPMAAGEHAIFRDRVTMAEVRQTPRLGGGFMAWDSLPAACDEGELYVTNRRLYFSGAKETRDIPIEDVVMVAPRDGTVELHRRDRPCPTLFGFAYARQLAAYIEHAQRQGIHALPAPAFGAQLTSPVTRIASPLQPAPAGPAALPSFITCARCGAANGLSANFCQNCSAPIAPGSLPTIAR